MGAVERLVDRFFSSVGMPVLAEVHEEIPSAPHPVPMSFFNVGGGAPYWGGSGSDGSKSPYGLSNSGQSPILDHWYARQNARSAFHESTIARSIVERFADSVVDVGLKLDATPKSDLLGISPEEAERWSARVESLFDLWARDKRSSRDEQLTFYQSQRLAEVFTQRDNDWFCRLFYSPKNRQLLNPLQIQFLDPNQIRGFAYTSTYGYQSGGDGIVRDDRGREIGYKVYIRDKDGTYQPIEIPAFGKKSGRRFVLHGFQPEYAGQGRGYSRLTHALQEFENVTDFTLAQIKKAINQASFAMYVKPSKENDASNPVEDIADQRYGAAAAAVGATPDPGVVESIAGSPVNFYSIPEATFNQPGSAGVFNLREGEDLLPFKDSAPSASFDSFVNAFTSYLSSSVSMPLEVLLMKFGQNYSASRGALLLFWRVAMIWREELAADLLNPIYEEWLSGEIASGRVSAPGWNDPRIRKAWTSNNWIGAPLPNIDPQRTAEAEKAYASIGATDLDRIARDLNGSDGPTNRAKLARQLEELPEVPWNKSKRGAD